MQSRADYFTAQQVYAGTFPANVATHTWTVEPDNCKALRARCEYSHAFNTLVMYGARRCAC